MLVGIIITAMPVISMAADLTLGSDEYTKVLDENFNGLAVDGTDANWAGGKGIVRSGADMAMAATGNELVRRGLTSLNLTNLTKVVIEEDIAATTPYSSFGFESILDYSNEWFAGKLAGQSTYIAHTGSGFTFGKGEGWFSAPTVYGGSPVGSAIVANKWYKYRRTFDFTTSGKLFSSVYVYNAVSYTHLTLPTIYSV